MMLFGGMLVNSETMPAWLSWIQWISPIRYGNEALAHTQFDEAHNVVWTTTLPPRPVDIPQTYMKAMGFDLGYTNCVLCIFGLLILWQVLAYIALISQIKKVSA